MARDPLRDLLEQIGGARNSRSRRSLAQTTWSLTHRRARTARDYRVTRETAMKRCKLLWCYG
jgi:hypothetical protein